MRREDVLYVLQMDANDKNGEILDITEESATYFDYNSDTEIEFRFEEACTDEHMRSLIHIGSGAANNKLTANYVIAVLKKAFGDDYFDAICTLSGIIIVSNEDEFKQMLKESIHTSDEADEWYDWEENQEYVGRMFTAHQIVFINENAVAKGAKELSFDKYEERKEYEIGMLVTLIHEMRHLMLDTNPFLPEDEFPEELREEDAVENFARQAYENLGKLRRWR